jgi:hypothetical protein
MAEVQFALISSSALDRPLSPFTFTLSPAEMRAAVLTAVSRLL